MLASSFITPVYAETEVKMTGTYYDKFELKGNGTSLFDIPIMNPGDVWENSISIKNTTSDNMEVKLSEITNKNKDNLLFDVLEVVIKINGEVIYEGLYKDVPSSKWVTVSPNSSMVVDVTLKFPGECGNEYQGKKLDSTWTFEARLPDGATPTPKPPKDDKNPVPTGVVSGLYVGASICLGSLLFFILLGKRKDDEEKPKNRKK